MKHEKDMKKAAKLTALKELRKEASGMMGEGLRSSMEMPKKSVTVAADNAEDLKKGLKKAEEMVPNLDKYMEESEEEDGMDTLSEEECEEMEESEDSSPEELRERIKELEAKLAKMSK